MNIKLSLIIFLAITSFISITSASSSFGYELTCYQGCDDNKVNIQNQIILKLEIKNDFSYWVVLDNNKYSSKPRIDITSENSNLEGDSEKISYSLSDSSIYIPPKDSLIFYIPLETYNNLQEEKRVGDWVIKSEFYPSSVDYYESPFNNKKSININSAYEIPSTIVASQLKFEGIGENVKINKSFLSSVGNAISNWFTSWIGYCIAGIVIIVIGSLIVYLLIKK